MIAADLLFFGMVGLLATHELDAVQKHEWRVLPLTSWMSDELGRIVFLVAHVPLFFLIAWVGAQGSMSPPAFLLSGFSIVHIGLHWVFRNNPKYEFRGLISNSLIAGAGVFGGAHLIVSGLG